MNLSGIWVLLRGEGVMVGMWSWGREVVRGGLLVAVAPRNGGKS